MLDGLLAPIVGATRTLNLLRRVAVDVAHVLRHVHEIKEIAMANFDALNERLDTLTSAVDAAKQRIGEDFQALKDQLATDAEDQAAVDAAVSRLDASIGALDTVDPDPAVPAEPANPADNPNG